MYHIVHWFYIYSIERLLEHSTTRRLDGKSPVSFLMISVLLPESVRRLNMATVGSILSWSLAYTVVSRYVSLSWLILLKNIKVRGILSTSVLRIKSTSHLKS